MNDEMNGVFKRLCEVIIEKLNEDEVNVEWAKEARELLKATKYEPNSAVPGSKVNEVNEALTGVPQFT